MTTHKRRYTTAECSMTTTMVMEPFLNDSLYIEKKDENEETYDGEFYAKPLDFDSNFENYWDLTPPIQTNK